MSVALWCLFFAAVLHFVSKIPVAIAQSQCEGGYDNHSPREQLSRLSDWGKRASAAHQNQIESFPLFAAGVLTATVTGAVSPSVSVIAVLYIIARLAFLVLYIKDVSSLRSMVWGIGFFSSLALICSPAWAL